MGYKRLLPVMDQQQIFTLNKSQLGKNIILFYTN